jgi:hypothetical protein
VSHVLAVLAAASEENVQTITWLHEHAASGAVELYAATIARALEEIVELPFAWPAWEADPEIRVRHLNRISISVIYRVRDRVVEVIAFAHQRRAPGYWLDRLR